MRRAYLLIIIGIAILWTSAGLKAQEVNPRPIGREVSANRLITFNGILKDASGQPHLGTTGITFTLYASQEGGEGLWQECQTVQTDEQGRYTALLGMTQKGGLPVEVFSNGKAQWLGVQVQGEDEQARVLLVAVPYALKAVDADTVGGKPLSSFVLYEDLIKEQEEETSHIIATEKAKGSIARRPMVEHKGNQGIQVIGPLFAKKDGIGPYYGNEVGNNTYYGQGAGTSLTIGNYNSFFGRDAGSSNNSTNNSFFGYYAGRLTTGGNNSFFGRDAGAVTTTANDNCFFGDGAGSNDTTGSFNSFYGFHSGLANTDEHFNSFLGAYSNGAAGITYATSVGARALVTRSNSLVLGSINGVNGASADTNVGIGTSSPDRQLVIEGTQAIARFTRFYGTADAFTRTFAPAFLFERSRGLQATPADIVAGDYLGKVQFRGRVGGNMAEYGALTFIATDLSQNGRLAFVDRDMTTERLSILNSGNIGIGTTTPTERLQVVGNLKVSGSILYGAPETEVPDYVFNGDYRLMSIEELGKYIAKEKHLPNVPKASEIKEKGLNLSDFQMKLLEKIEELTLYTVQQAKTISQKDSEVATLKSQNAALDTRLVALEQIMDRLTKNESREQK